MRMLSISQLQVFSAIRRKTTLQSQTLRDHDSLLKNIFELYSYGCILSIYTTPHEKAMIYKLEPNEYTKLHKSRRL